MQYWISSRKRKRHQRAMNKLVREFNKSLTEDDLWQGRFQVYQVHSPGWYPYEDGSGADLAVCLRVVDRATGRYFERWKTVNEWNGIRASGYRIWELTNWLITQHWDIWKEGLARERRMDEWKEYNRTTRVV